MCLSFENKLFLSSFVIIKNGKIVAKVQPEPNFLSLILMINKNNKNNIIADIVKSRYITISKLVRKMVNMYAKVTIRCEHK